MLATWRLRAACLGTNNPELFFSNRDADVDRARAICASCPVTSQCAAAAASEKYGTWAGLTPEDRGRKTLKSYRRRAAA
jgi:hypothetical protein